MRDRMSASASRIPSRPSATASRMSDPSLRNAPAKSRNIQHAATTGKNSTIFFNCAGVKDFHAVDLRAIFLDKSCNARWRQLHIEKGAEARLETILTLEQRKQLKDPPKGKTPSLPAGLRVPRGRCVRAR